MSGTASRYAHIALGRGLRRRQSVEKIFCSRVGRGETQWNTEMQYLVLTGFLFAANGIYNGYDKQKYT